MFFCFPTCLKKPNGSVDLIYLCSVLLIALFFVTLITSYLFPIYPDEITVRVWLSRIVYDFPYKISIYPTCEGFLQKLPISWFFPGFIEWVIHGNLGDIRQLRLLGIVVELVLISILAYQLSISQFSEFTDSIHKKASPSLTTFQSVAFVISLLSIGVLPIFLVTNRQEQLVLPLVAILLIIFVNLDQYAERLIPKKKLLLSSLVYFTSVSLILYSHPKGIFLSPFFILIGLQIFRQFKNKWLMALGLVALVVLLIQSYVAWKYTFQCTKNPELNSLLKSFYIDPFEAVYDPSMFFHELIRSMGNFGKYITQLTFKYNTDVSYLPSVPVGVFATIANFLIMINVSVMLIGTLVFLPFFCVKDISKGRLISINLVLLVLLVCILLGALLSLTKNWYDAGYFYVMLVIVCVFIFASDKHKLLKKSTVVVILIYLSCTAIFSQIVFNYRYLPAFWGGFAGPGVSIKKYDYQSALNDISASSKACAIDPIASKGVIFDDYTYFHFQKSQRPMAITYVLYLKGQALTDFIAESGSDGIVARCSSIPKEYLPYAKATGSVCCIPRVMLKKLANSGLYN